MKKVKRNHQEWKRDKFRLFHLREDIPTMPNPSFQKNKSKASTGNRKSIRKVIIFTLSLERLTTEVLLTFQTIIFKSFKKNNSSHLQVGLEREQFTKANNLLYRKMRIKTRENKMANKAEGGLTPPSIRTEKTLVEVGQLLRVQVEELKIKC